MNAYMPFASLAHAHAYVSGWTRHEQELVREAETRRLTELFARIDIRVHDDYSQSRCCRDVPLPLWRRW